MPAVELFNDQRLLPFGLRGALYTGKRALCTCVRTVEEASCWFIYDYLSLRTFVKKSSFALSYTSPVSMRRECMLSLVRQRPMPTTALV